MKSLTDDLVEKIAEGDELQDSIPAGHYAIRGPRGYILMPDEVSVDDWVKNQDKHPYQKPECNSRGQRAHKCPIERNVATNGCQVAPPDITEGRQTEASIRADEDAFDKLFPDLKEG